MGRPRVRTSVVCLQNEQLLCFRAEDPQSGKNYIFLPGGQIEPEETAPEAAERETFEETGFRVTVDASRGVDREYSFFWNGETYDCLTIFYPARLTSPLQAARRPEVHDASYHRGVVWLPKDQIFETFSYSEDIRDAILELVGEPSRTETP